MTEISTENLKHLPNPIKLKKICKSISVLEAIISPEWEFRYYSYQKKWSENEEFCEMRNGEGDQMLIIFQENGTCINGFAHESSFMGWKNGVQKIADGIINELPIQFKDFIFGEPVKSIGTTFCIWSMNQDDWKIGQVKFPKDDHGDGSEYLLNLLDGKPTTYEKWAKEYYEVELDIKVIEQIYQGSILTKEMVTKINPNFLGFKQLVEDLEDIGYKYDLN